MDGGLNDGQTTALKPATGRSHRWANVLLLTISLGLPFVAGELVLQFLALPADSPNLFVEVRSEVETLGTPFGRGLYAGAPVQFNSLGLRERDFGERAAGRARIAVLGDSMTFGMGVTQDRVYPRVLEIALNSAGLKDHDSVEVGNFGMPGYNTIQELAMLREFALRFHPDIVVVGFLYNDVTLTPRQLAKLGVSGGGQPAGAVSRVNGIMTWLKSQSELLRFLSARVAAIARRFGGKSFGEIGNFRSQFEDGSLGWTQARRALLDMKSLGKENHFELVVMIIPATVKLTADQYPIKEYHEAVSEFCRKNGIPHLDLLTALAGTDFSRLWISPTDGHPNAEGHRLIGEALARFLLEASLSKEPLR